MLSAKLISIIIIIVIVVGGLFYLGSRGTGTIPILGTLTNLFGDSAPVERNLDEENAIARFLNKLFDKNIDRALLETGTNPNLDSASDSMAENKTSNVCMRELKGESMELALPDKIDGFNNAPPQGVVDRLYENRDPNFITINPGEAFAHYVAYMDYDGPDYQELISSKTAIIAVDVIDLWNLTGISSDDGDCVEPAIDAGDPTGTSLYLQTMSGFFKTHYENPNQDGVVFTHIGSGANDLFTISNGFSEEATLIDGLPAIRLFLVNEKSYLRPNERKDLIGEYVLIGDRILVSIYLEGTIHSDEQQIFNEKSLNKVASSINFYLLEALVDSQKPE